MDLGAQRIEQLEPGLARVRNLRPADQTAAMATMAPFSMTR